MYAAFEKLPEERKDNILRICLEEFAENGYDHTSTDRITSKAGISKGILFHYFKSKKNVYLYILKHTRQLLWEQGMDMLHQLKTNDFFERLQQMTLHKFQLNVAYPLETKLWMDALTYPPRAAEAEIAAIVGQHWQEYMELQELIYRQDLIEAKSLREGVSTQSVVKLTQAIVEKLANEFQARMKGNPQSLAELQAQFSAELNVYMDLIRYGCFRTMSDTN